MTDTDTNDNKFPDYVDESSAGIVYFIMFRDLYKTVELVDATEFKRWDTEYLNEASELTLEYTVLTMLKLLI